MNRQIIRHKKTEKHSPKRSDYPRFLHLPPLLRAQHHPRTPFAPTPPTPMAVKRIDGNEKREKANNLSIFENNPSFNWEKWANFADEIVKTS
ncbi:MAG: hypothetical protein J6M19_03720 [Bacteroidaceae bacterium]|nr:hypothetical protein [Bacteroidaceae bacterium]